MAVRCIDCGRLLEYLPMPDGDGGIVTAWKRVDLSGRFVGSVCDECHLKKVTRAHLRVINGGKAG